MPHKNQPPLLLTLKPSKRLKQLLVVIHLLAWGSSIANALTVTVKIALLLGIGLHLYYTIKRLKNVHCQIKHTDAFGWEIAAVNDFSPVQILNSTVITLFAVFLHVNGNGHKQSILVMNDALTEDEYRYLIVRLKTSRKKA